MNRETENITQLVAEALTDLNELKNKQYFGGDSLTVNEYETVLSDDASVDYTLTLTPDNRSLGVLPSSVELRWNNPNMNSQAAVGYFVRQVYRSDGVFEWHIFGGHADDYLTYLLIQWIGRGTVDLVRNS